ncbi:MAG: glycoside hydrolase family 3 C-terminal domain-containing protein [Lachnospiraceae bacterium]|nr:glycoside hydrolase family 3 C-terminal domain-containing protein [Lachnospiraceae bacterium]
MYQEELCRKKAKELVSKMTLEEKASQLRYDAPAIPRLGVKSYNWWNEALHGVARSGTATSFPQAIGLAAMFDKELVEKIGDAVAIEGRAKYNASQKQEDHDIYKGLTFWAPNVNIFRDPRWGRGHETYGEDPYLTGELGKAYIRGIQGDGTHMKAAACAKHFAVHSGPEDLRHEFDVEVSDRDLYETYLPAFKECVTEAQVESVMGAYNRVFGEPCCGSYFLLKDILRDRWQFQGHVVSDCWAIRDFHTHHMVTATPEDSAALAIHAGCDLNCGNTYLMIMKAYEQGKVTEEEITQSAERLFTTRFKLGIEDGSEFDEIPYEKVECREHLKLAETATEKSCVLLKNDGVLPLQKDALKSIGVIGPNANSRLALKGNYYGTSSRYVTLLEGIQKETGDDVRVFYAKGCELIKDRTEPLAMEHDRLAEAVTVAEHSDVVLLCLGLDETLEGEETDEGNHYGSGDKEDLELPEVQKQLLEKVLATGKPVVLLLLGGSALNIARAQEACSGILLCWYPGARGGEGIANLLFGKVSPSGKLPVTFYDTLEDLPAFTDYSMRNRTYRYYSGKPLYPFGYGLTYGSVVCRDAAVRKEGEKVMISVKVENQGIMDTEDVVQIYGQNLESENVAENPVLCGFQRVFVGAGEKREIQIEIQMDVLYPVDHKGDRVKEGEKFQFYAGTSQPDSRSIELTGITPIGNLLEHKV